MAVKNQFYVLNNGIEVLSFPRKGEIGFEFGLAKNIFNRKDLKKVYDILVADSRLKNVTFNTTDSKDFFWLRFNFNGNFDAYEQKNIFDFISVAIPSFTAAKSVPKVPTPTTTQSTPTTTPSVDLTNLPFKVGDKFHAAKPLPIYTITKIEQDGIDIEYQKDDGSIGTLKKGYTIDKVKELFKKRTWTKVSSNQNTQTTTNGNVITNITDNDIATLSMGDKIYWVDGTIYTIKSVNYVKSKVNSFEYYVDDTPNKIEETFYVDLINNKHRINSILKYPALESIYVLEVGDIISFINSTNFKKYFYYINDKLANGFSVTTTAYDNETGEVVSSVENTIDAIYIRDFWFDGANPYSNIKSFKITKGGSVPTATTPTVDATPTPTTTPKQSVFGSDESLVEQLKKDVSQLLFIRSLLSPIDFEKKIEIGQEISKKQKEIDILIFRMTEKKVNDVELFDNLFEQSFTPIQNTYDGVYAEIGNEEFANFFTPNGKPSALSDELNALIRTKQFKEWFGDWQLDYIYKDSGVFDIDCSKVLTSNFEPLLVWHGTGQDFSYFKFDTFPAAYFAVNEKYSKWFAELHGGDDGYTIPFFLNIRNPLDLTPFGTTPIRPKDFFDYIYLKTGLDVDALDVNPIFLDPSCPEKECWFYIRNNPKMILKLSESKLTDGIHFYETNPNVPTGEAHETEAYIIFNANQCKIAAPNRGLLLLSSLQSFLLKRGGKI